MSRGVAYEKPLMCDPHLRGLRRCIRYVGRNSRTSVVSGAFAAHLRDALTAPNESNDANDILEFRRRVGDDRRGPAERPSVDARV